MFFIIGFKTSQSWSEVPPGGAKRAWRQCKRFGRNQRRLRINNFRGRDAPLSYRQIYEPQTLSGQFSGAA